MFFLFVRVGYMAPQGKEKEKTDRERAFTLPGIVELDTKNIRKSTIPGRVRGHSIHITTHRKEKKKKQNS